MKDQTQFTLRSVPTIYGRMTKLALVASTVAIATTSAQADSTAKYHLVADVVGNNDADLLKAYPSNNDDNIVGFGYATTPSLSPTVGGQYAASRYSFYFTGWDLPGAPQSSKLYEKLGYSSPNAPAYSTDITVAQQEKEYSLSLAASPLIKPDAGVYCRRNGSSGTSNPYFRARNLRAVFSGVPFDSPKEVSYSNIVDRATYSAWPTNGIRGYATPNNLSFGGIVRVYLSIQRASDGLYWSGSTWSTAQVNLPTVTQLVNPYDYSSPNAGRVEWSKTDNLPPLSGSQYTLRTMAVENIGGSSRVGSGTLRTIDFTVSGTTTPPQPPSDTTIPNPSVLTYPTPYSVIGSLYPLAGTCNDNPGGSGVKSVTVNIVYEGNGQYGNPIHWNWRTRSWQPYASGTNTSDNYLAAQVTGGTQWSTQYSGGVAPSSSQLYTGYYTIRLFAKDNAGNGDSYAAYSSTYYVSGGAPYSGKSSLQSSLKSDSSNVTSLPMPDPPPLPLPEVKAKSGGAS